jgi:hypothetical protein
MSNEMRQVLDNAIYRITWEDGDTHQSGAPWDLAALKKFTIRLDIRCSYDNYLNYRFYLVEVRMMPPDIISSENLGPTLFWREDEVTLDPPAFEERQ